MIASKRSGICWDKSQSLEKGIQRSRVATSSSGSENHNCLNELRTKYSSLSSKYDEYTHTLLQNN